MVLRYIGVPLDGLSARKQKVEFLSFGSNRADAAIELYFYGEVRTLSRTLNFSELWVSHQKSKHD